MDDEPDADLNTTEREALHDLQLGIEHFHRGYGHLLAFHHAVGRGMNRFEDAREKFRETGHEGPVDALRDDLLPAGVFDERWSYELVETFADGFLAAAVEFESDVRKELADGRRHVTERHQRRARRERSEDHPTDQDK
ncbi:hypothetical protein [Halococcus sediminicola]|uniref:hypothetical protein n=1 Tax=Halococcus sediminicola TaxID=1264579 RepID=UPI0009ACEEF7|nr:hypothetical protein [Halococcus sediminicola]